MAFSTKYVQFNGTDEHVSMGNVLAYERTQAFSWSCWEKFTSAGALMSKEAAAPTMQGIAWYVESDGGMYITISNDFSTGNNCELATSDTRGIADDGSWHHLVVTYAGDSLASSMKFYCDGVLMTSYVNTEALAGTIVSTADLLLAANSVEHFGGGLDEVAIHNKELSQAEVTWLYNSGVARDLLGGGAPSNLVAWWRMGEGDTSPTLLDQTTGHYDGAMVNMDAGNIRNFALEAEASVQGDSSVSALSLVRKPYVPVVRVPSSQVGPQRTLGFQPGRVAPTKDPSFVVNPAPTRRRG